MNIEWKPIQPSKPFADPHIRANVERQLLLWASSVTNRMGAYPSQQPTKYRRTGTLGRGWATGIKVASSANVIVARVSNVVPYAGYVQGFDAGDKGTVQTATMAGKGWGRLDAVAEQQWSSAAVKIGKALLAEHF